MLLLWNTKCHFAYFSKHFSGCPTIVRDHNPRGLLEHVYLFVLFKDNNYGRSLCRNFWTTKYGDFFWWGLILLIHYWFLWVAALGPLIPLFCVLPCYMYWWSHLQSMIVFQMVSPFLEQPICQPINFWTGPPSWGSPFSSQSGLRFTQQLLAWAQASVCLSASREELCI